MPKEYSRTQRIAELIQHELAEMLLHKVEDPQLKNISLLQVEVAKDLSFAKVHISCLDEDPALIKDKLQRLNKAASYLRYLLANSIELRTTPQLKFIYDPSLHNTNRLLGLLKAAPDASQEDQE